MLSSLVNQGAVALVGNVVLEMSFVKLGVREPATQLQNVVNTLFQISSIVL